jgi:hypothetical protein
MALSDERIDDLAQNYGLDWLDYEPFARAIEAEARAKAFSEAYDLLFDVKGCKATRFDAQNAIREPAAPVDVQAWIELARARLEKAP